MKFEILVQQRNGRIASVWPSFDSAMVAMIGPCRHNRKQFPAGAAIVTRDGVKLGSVPASDYCPPAYLPKTLGEVKK